MIPVLLVGYKRVDQLTGLLRKSIECGATRIYIAIDAVDSENGISIANEFESRIAEIILDFPESEINVWLRKENLGSSLSVITAIEWAFQFEETVAVLEDDLDISIKLLDFFSTQVKMLVVDSKILMLSGSNPFRGLSKTECSGYSHYPVVWGWATTRSKWNVIREGILNANYPFEDPTIQIRVRNFLEAGRNRAQSRLIDAWDVPLAAFMRARGYKCLIPSANLVSNTGYDQNATHTTKKKWPLGVAIEEGGNFDEEYSQNYDPQMESLILGIKRRHIFSKLKLKISTLLRRKKIPNFLLAQEFSAIVIPGRGITK